MKNILKYLIITGVILIILLIITLIFQSSAKNPETVKIGYLPIMSSVTFYIAYEKGFFEEQGIDIEIVQLQSSNNIIEGIIRGDLDVSGGISAVPVLITHTIDPDKIKIFSVSDFGPETPFDAIIVKKDSELNTIWDLENKKIGVFPGSTSTILLKTFLMEKDIDVSGIEFIQITPPNQLMSLYSGSIDALHAYEPSVAIALEDENVKKIYDSVYGEQIDNNPMGVTIISSKFISENPEIAEKIIKAFDKAADFMDSDEEETREIIAKYLNLEKNVAEKMVLLKMTRSDEINPNKLQEYSNMIYELGELPSKVNTSEMIYGL